MRRLPRGPWLGLALASSLMLARPVLAQSTADATTRAREHYERGVGLFDEGQFVAALAEFEAAYALTHRATLLFNVGQIHARLGHAVEATEALERYLAEAGEVSPERRALVEAELATQRARIARLEVDVSVEGAAISLDDVERGRSPLATPLSVSAGEHVLVVSADGHEASRRRFRIAGGETQTLRVEFIRLSPVDANGGPPRALVSPSSSTTPFPALTTVGAVIAGAGLVAFGVGGLVTLLEHARLTDPSTGCSPSCTAEQTSTVAVTRVVADVGLGVLAVGGVLTVIGAVLELGGSSSAEGPRVALDAGGLVVSW